MINGDIQNSPGQGPVQPALGDPASSGGLDQIIHRDPFQPWTFCDSVILWIHWLPWKTWTLEINVYRALNKKALWG